MDLIDTKLLGVFWDAIKSFGGEMKCTSEKTKKDINGNSITDYYVPKNNVKNKGSENTPVYFNSNGVATPISYYDGECAISTVAKGLDVGTIGNGDKLVYFKDNKAMESNSNIGANNTFVYINNGKITPSTATVGSATKLMYLNNGKFYASQSNLGGNTQGIYLKDGALSICQGNVGGEKTTGTFTPIYMKNGVMTEAASNVGANNSPIYIQSGAIKKSTANVGNEKAPIYLKNGAFVECNQYPDNLLLDKVYPVGSIYMSTNSTSPATFLGGTWVQLKGRFLLGCGAIESNTTTQYGTVTAGELNRATKEKGGEVKHTISEAEMPKHSHTKGTMRIVGGFDGNVNDGDSGLTGPFYNKNVAFNGSDGGKGGGIIGFDTDKNDCWTGATSIRGGSEAHNNMPPYLSVYMWERTK